MILNFVKMADSSRWQHIQCDWQLPKVDHLLSQPRSFHQTSEACGTLQVAMIGFARLRRGENFPPKKKVIRISNKQGFYEFSSGTAK